MQGVMQAKHRDPRLELMHGRKLIVLATDDYAAMSRAHISF